LNNAIPQGFRLVTKGGKRCALWTSHLFPEIRLMDTEFDRLTAETGKAYQGIERGTATKEI